MRIDQTKYTKQFNFHGIDEWIGIRVCLNEGDDEMEALRLAKNTAVKFFNEGVSEASAEINAVKSIMTTPIKPMMDMIVLRKYQKALLEKDEETINNIKAQYHVES